MTTVKNMTAYAPGHPAHAADTATLAGVAGESGRVRRWPLVLIAAPAAVAIWSGWVGLGGMCGFGPIHPLPGIAGRFVINTAITLPVGVEAYGAYALRAWLTPGAPARAQQFARRSAIGALALGMCGQVIYHLLSAAHAGRAPWPVVMLVSCIPVITLGFGAALTHLLRDGVTDGATLAGPVGPPAGPVPDPGRAGERTEPDRGGPDDGRTDEIPDRADLPGKDAVVASIAGEIRAAIEAGERWRPDAAYYDGLMQATGMSKSWCEKAVRRARLSVLDPPPDPGRTDGRTVTPRAAPGRERTGGDRADGRTGETSARDRTDDDPAGADQPGELALAGAP